MTNLSPVQKAMSYFLKITVIVATIIGVGHSIYISSMTSLGGQSSLMFFTTQSNIGIAVVCFIGCFLMQGHKPVSRVWHVIKFVSTVSITLTCVVFGLILAPTLGAEAWNVGNTLTHLIVPMASVADFFVVGTGTRINNDEIVYVIIPPLLYSIYASVGYANGWEFVEGYNYPYFFLNWGSKAGAFGITDELPFIGTAWWILVLFIFLMFVGYIYVLISKKVDAVEDYI
ncbi:MAG: Pr6Pr family membrane protein [Pseudobutyrivibrio sp.]|nr:Pr6Pr family membrane protein [Pseudobutyrivibrio sp.]